jgi:ParB family transcriptional regulator, chromosome partitioning protein
MSTGPDKSRRALGKGLSALLPPRPSAPQHAGTAAAMAEAPQAAEAATRVPIGLIDPNPVQPRTVFSQDRLEELAQSIRANGVIQPLIVRKSGERYELIAGERRWRASKLADLSEVPVFVQDFAQDRLLEIALIENIQREDLNPIEAAHAFDRLAREMGLSHEEIGRRTGKDRSSIANMIRLLKLPPEVQRLMAENRLPMGQARAILALEDAAQQVQIAEKAAAQGMSTRQVEALVRQITAARAGGAAAPEPTASKQDPNVRAAADELQRVLGTRVRIIEQSDSRGKIEIEYYSQEDLNRIYAAIVGES